MHINHDYTAKLIADAAARDYRNRSQRERLIRCLRMKYRRQMILWLCYIAKKAGESLVAWSERLERPHQESLGSTGLAPSGG
jgi:hypothetical protein